MDAVRGSRALLARALVLAALVVAVMAGPAGAHGGDSPWSGFVTGSPATTGPNYDRNASVVQDGRFTYLFYAHSQLAPCNRLASPPDRCDPDQRKYDLYYKKSSDGGRSFGAPHLAATNPDPTPDLQQSVPYGGFRGRTIAATKTGNKVLVFWADGGNQRQLYEVEKPAGTDTFTAPTPVAGVEPAVFNVEAVTRGTQTFLYTEQTGTQGYGVYARTTTGTTAGPGQLVMLDRNIPKAIVDKRNGFVRLTYVDATMYPQVDDYVNSSPDGLNFTGEHLAVKSAPNESLWDPNLLQLDHGYLLFMAPDRQLGAGRQQIAVAGSTDFVHWTRPRDVTPGIKDGVEYWDYWPEPFRSGDSLFLYYTSERGFAGNPTGIGHIWSLGGRADDD
jgi:hypothetical protein